MPETILEPRASLEVIPYAPPSGDWLIMHETDPATIQVQIEAGVQARGGSYVDFLNNLADNLPGGRRRDESLAHKYPSKFGPDCKRYTDTTQWTDWQKAAHSEKMANATFGQFYQDIETAIAAVVDDPHAGITRENLLALNQARTARQLSGHPETYAPLLSREARAAYEGPLSGNMQEALAKDLARVYAELRKMGYSHYDLFQ
jgi:hypothetical protein